MIWLLILFHIKFIFYSLNYKIKCSNRHSRHTMPPYFCHVTWILRLFAQFAHCLHTRFFLSENGRAVTNALLFQLTMDTHSTQWAAVSTQFGLTSEPPQMWLCWRNANWRYWRDTCHGHFPGAASAPFTIRWKPSENYKEKDRQWSCHCNDKQSSIKVRTIDPMKMTFGDAFLSWKLWDDKKYLYCMYGLSHFCSHWKLINYSY